MILFIIGPAASGKGTQADLLSKQYNIPHLSMGELLRDEIASGSETGKKIESIVNSGVLVPTDITSELLVKAVEKAVSEHGGVIIDGYPRTFDQIGVFDQWLSAHPTFTRCIHYALPFEECIRRQQTRSATAGQARADDAALEERYREYTRNIEPIVSYYKDKGEYIEVDASGTIDEIFQTTVDNLSKQIPTETEAISHTMTDNA